MNKLRAMFYDTPEFEQRINKIRQQLIDDKHCSYCVNSIQEPYSEMGHDAGTVTRCKMFNELKLDYYDGQQCLFWQMKGGE